MFKVILEPHYYHSSALNIHYLGSVTAVTKAYDLTDIKLYDLYVCSPRYGYGDNGAVIARYGNNAADFAWSTIDNINNEKADVADDPTWSDGVALIEAYTRARTLGFIREE